MGKTRSSSQIKPRKPKALLTRPIKLDAEKLFKALAKAAVDTATLQWSKLAGDAVEAAAALKLAATPEELAYALAARGRTRLVDHAAIYDAIG